MARMQTRESRRAQARPRFAISRVRLTENTVNLGRECGVWGDTAGIVESSRLFLHVALLSARGRHTWTYRVLRRWHLPSECGVARVSTSMPVAGSGHHGVCNHNSRVLTSRHRILSHSFSFSHLLPLFCILLEHFSSGESPANNCNHVGPPRGTPA